MTLLYRIVNEVLPMVSFSSFLFMLFVPTKHIKKKREMSINSGYQLPSIFLCGLKINNTYKEELLHNEQEVKE